MRIKPRPVDIKKLDDAFDRLDKAWPSEFVVRAKIAEFSGGMIGLQTMATYDREGTGPTRTFKMGPRRVVYLKKDLIEWMRKRITMR